ncbi:MAG: hypothetical protein AAFQ21_16575, partial [Pseudomonadota bacterium]
AFKSSGSSLLRAGFLPCCDICLAPFVIVSRCQNVPEMAASHSRNKRGVDFHPSDLPRISPQKTLRR